jgi:hypothetical protein
MRYRKLRIAWSVAWGVVCALLVVLWVRSSHHAESIYIPVAGSYEFSCYSEYGSVQFDIIDYGTGEFALDSEEIEPMGYVPPGQGFWWYLGFAVDSWPGGSVVMLPYWLICGVSVCIVIAPWIRLSNRFSLRTLLIATTLVAVMLGLIVWLR